MLFRLRIFLTLLFCTLVTSAEPVSDLKPESVLFRSGNATLYGCVYKPKGKGPFPAIVFNQSATRPSYEKIDWPPFLSLAQFFTAHGYVFFLPGRYPHEELEHQPGPTNAVTKSAVPKWALESDARNSDVVAGISWLRGQSYIDEDRLVLCGHSAGAIQALLVAAKEPDIRGTIIFSVGAMSWKNSAVLQDLLQKAVLKIETPIFLLQPQNDYTIEPSRILGNLASKNNLLNRVKVYPPFGTKQSEANLFGLNGSAVWGEDVLDFLSKTVK